MCVPVNYQGSGNTTELHTYSGAMASRRIESVVFSVLTGSIKESVGEMTPVNKYLICFCAKKSKVIRFFIICPSIIATALLGTCRIDFSLPLSAQLVDVRYMLCCDRPENEADYRSNEILISSG